MRLGAHRPPRCEAGLPTVAGGTVTSLPKFIDTVTLASSGTHTVEVDPTGGNTGGLTLNLYDVPPDLTGSTTPGGAPVQLALTTPGQNGELSFSGTIGQRISLTISSAPTGSVQIKNPDGSTLGSESMGFIPKFIDTTELGQTGIYTIPVNPSTFNAGTVTLTLNEVPSDVTGTLTVNGGAVPVSIGTAGQNGRFTFAGTGAQAVSVRVTGNTTGLVTVRLLRPDDTVMTSTTSLFGTFTLAQQTLPTTGTYSIVVDPSKANTGGLNLSVTNP